MEFVQMNISITNSNYNIIRTESVLLFSPTSDLTLHVEANSDFKFCIILQFIDVKSDDGSIKKEVINESTLVFKFAGFNNPLGTGSSAPMPIATVSGKSWYLHVWSSLMGNEQTGKVRKVEYTIFEEV